jgi:hypothetical protein
MLSKLRQVRGKKPIKSEQKDPENLTTLRNPNLSPKQEEPFAPSSSPHFRDFDLSPQSPSSFAPRDNIVGDINRQKA